MRRGLCAAAIVGALSEWRRVLRRRGSVFLNIGDTYAKKSLAGVRAQLGDAAREQGGIIRSRFFGAKPGGMPGPPRTRLANRHESMLRLTVGHDYYRGKAHVTVTSKRT